MVRRPKGVRRGIARAAFAVPLLATVLAGVVSAADRLPSIDEIIEAKTDILGEAAIRQAGGPSYEFFAAAMPPLRYVNSAFRHYPIVLAAPRNGCKARLVSNGSEINAKGNLSTWQDVGLPISFCVGPKEAAFGDDLAKLDGPRLADGYLPIVGMSYRDGDTTYRQEVFVSVEPALADHARGVRAILARWRSSGEGHGAAWGRPSRCTWSIASCATTASRCSHGSVRTGSGTRRSKRSPPRSHPTARPCLPCVPRRSPSCPPLRPFPPATSTANSENSA